VKNPIARILFAVVTLAVLIPVDAFARHEATFGVESGYASENESAIAGLFFQYDLTGGIRIAPDAGFVFRHKNLDAFTANVNLHFPFSFPGRVVGLYPLAGVNFSSWNRHNIDFDTDTDDVSTRASRFGLNFGAGVELRPTSTLKLKAELKYNLIKSFSGYYVSVGIGYMF